MRFRNAIKAIFGNAINRITQSWKEVGGYTANFFGFGKDIYANDVVRSCIRSLAEHTSKANVRVRGDKRLEKLIQLRPNIYMNGKDFLYKVRTLLEINNIVFIYIMRDDRGRCSGLYPMPKCDQMDAVEDMSGGLYIRFAYPNTVLTHSWDDLAVLRKDYNTGDIFSDDNSALLESLDLLTTTNQGMANAIKSTANLRGILKSTKAMLSEEDVKKNKDRFVQDYMNLTNTSGIVSLDATQEFKELNIQPAIANYKSVEELRLNIYRYFGVNENIITSQAKSDEWQAFYEGKIEGFLIALSLELTYKIFGFGEREVMFEANRMAYLSVDEKLAFVQMVDRRAMTPNEWRQILNLSPLEGGDVLMSWQDPQNTATQEESNDNEG
jgi:HK97 family phage portal protein